MADGNIYVNYGEFDNWAGKFSSINKELRSKLDEIQRKINGLAGDYESNAAVEIRSKITDMTKRFDSYEKVVDDYCSFLRRAAENWKATEAGITNNASNFI